MRRLFVFGVLLVAAALQARGVAAQTCASALTTEDCTVANADTGTNGWGCTWNEGTGTCAAVDPCPSGSDVDTCLSFNSESLTAQLPSGCKWDYLSSSCSAVKCALVDTCGDYPSSCSIDPVSNACVSRPVCGTASSGPDCNTKYGSTCMWDVAINRCVSSVGCIHPTLTTAAQCTWASQFEVKNPTGCAWDTLSSTCVDRATCASWGTANNGADCTANACYFDVWEQGCFDNVGVVNTLHECSYWRTVSSWQQACDAHGCTAMGDECYATIGSTDQGPPTAIAQSNIASWSNVQQVPQSDIFSFHTKVPFSVNTNPNSWWAAAVGSYSTNIGATLATNYVQCTSLAALVDGKPIYPTNFNFDDPAGLKFNVFDWIKRYRNLDFTPFPTGAQPSATYPLGAAGADVTSQFNTAPSYEAAMLKTYGNFKTAPNAQADSQYLIRSVDMSADGNLIDWEWRIKLSDVMECPGVSSSTTAEGDTIYVIPTGVLQLNSYGGIAGVYNVFYATHSGKGEMTITPNSRYRSHAFVRNAVILQGTGPDDCGAGNARMFVTYTVVYYGVADPSVRVGPRNLADIHKKSTSAEQYEIDNAGFKVLANQYHDEFYGFEGPICDYAKQTCSFTVKSKSECRVLHASGDSFILSQYANPTNKALYTEQPIPGSGFNTKDEAYASLENKHDFYVDVYTCNPSDCVGTATRFNAAPSGIYDTVGVTMQMKAYPIDHSVSSSYEVTGGLLDKGGVGPTETDLSHLRVMAIVPATVGGAPVLPTEFSVESSDYTMSISWRSTIVPVIRLTTANLPLRDLRIGIGEADVSITPVQANGFVMGAPANYNALKPLMTYVPKNAKIGCAMCVGLPIAETNFGIDGFAIPIANLMTLWPGVQFQGLEIKLTYFVGAAAANGGGNVPAAGGLRRLLSEPNYSVTYNSDGTISQVYIVRIEWDPETSSSTGVSFIPLEPIDLLPAKVPSDAPEKIAISAASVIGGNVLIGAAAFLLTV